MPPPLSWLRARPLPHDRPDIGGTGVIGYYIHHHGHGHLHRALTIQAAMTDELTGLSTLRRPASWRGGWVQLPDDAHPESTTDPTVDGWLHYAPDHHEGLRLRMSAISAWIAAARPSCLVVDVSVEVALLARLHGIPVVTMAQPGERTDPVHTLGYGISTTVIAPWPAAGSGIWRSRTAREKVVHVGAISRFAAADVDVEPVPRRIVVLNGTGGAGFGASVGRARAANPAWEWLHLERSAGTWVDDPWPLLQSASVIVSHCGQNAVAEIAAARRPAILIPQDRPFDEQRWLASAFAESEPWPALVLDGWPRPDFWADLLDRAQALDGRSWSSWHDGGGARRAAAVMSEPVGDESMPA